MNILSTVMPLNEHFEYGHAHFIALVKVFRKKVVKMYYVTATVSSYQLQQTTSQPIKSDITLYLHFQSKPLMNL